ncbi:molybdopterin-dependent oxidoreductase [Thermodesulfobacteriota bacterium]
MENWEITNCVLCVNGCGLEVRVENNHMVKVRPDKTNPRSEGYVCRKGLNIIHHHDHGDRLMHPLKRVDDTFKKISWDQAFDEIAEKLSTIVDKNGPRAFAVMGLNGKGCDFRGAFGKGVLNGLGSKYHYRALAQELTGKFWADGRSFGKQYLHNAPDMAETDMLLIVGWNPMMSQHTPQARRVLTKMSKNPDKLLVVIDPRLSETAKLADIHLPVRPGTDTLLYCSMISIILNEGWQDQAYMDRHVNGFDAVRTFFAGFDVKTALTVCELDFENVREVCRLFATRKSSFRSDLGILYARHSTLNSYLENVLLSICGRVGIKGGNLFPGSLFGPGAHSDERDPKTWRTIATNFPAICGIFPPNVMPEEILIDSPDRLRAVIVNGANPLRSFADTAAYEKAFNQLDLLVTMDIAMTETAALSHYVLPCCSGYETWDGSMMGSHPKVFFQMRQPVVKAEGERMDSGEIFTRLADRLGIIPEIPERLHETAAYGDRNQFAVALKDHLAAHPDAKEKLPFILSKTLGRVMGSGNLALLWGMLQNLSPGALKNAERFGLNPGPELGEKLFQMILDHPQGLWVGEIDVENNLSAIATENGRINLDVPEMAEWLQEIDPKTEAIQLKGDDTFPLILRAGRHMDMNINTMMRDPVWNKGKKPCTLLMHPDDAEKLSLKDSQMVKVSTEAGEETIELEVTRTTRPGMVFMPHGFGLVFQGETYGANVNRLTKNTHRDRLAGTPLHGYVPCNVKPE